MAYLYALIESEDPPGPRLDGVDSLPVDMLALGPVTVAVSAVTYRPEASLVAIRQHQAVLEALMTRGPVLPFRFATVVSDLEALAEAVRSALPSIIRNLAEVAGCVELGIVAGLPHEGGVRPAPTGEARTSGGGRDYLLRLCREAAQRAESARTSAAGIDRLDRHLRALARLSRQLPRSISDDLFRSVYLVPRASVQAFRAAVLAADRAGAAPLLLAFGPWPPYSFVRADLLNPATGTDE